MKDIAKNLQSIAGVASVQFLGRSGSYLLSNLFDSHPNVLSCPPHSLQNCLETLYFLVNDARRPKNNKIQTDELAERVCATFPTLFELDNTNILQHERYLGNCAHKMEYGANKKKFQNRLQEYFVYCIRQTGTLSIESIFKCIHLAYAESRNREFGDKLWIVWQQHVPFNPISFQIIETTFPVFLFLTAIRRPIKSLDSHIFHHTFDNPIKSACLYTKLFYSFMRTFFGSATGKRTDASTIELVREPSKFENIAIRFEDLHLKTEQTMVQILKKMELPFDKILLETTLDGSPFLFQKGDKYITGTRNSLNSENILNIFSEEDYSLLRFVFADIDQYFEYKPFKPKFETKLGSCPSFRESYKKSQELDSVLRAIVLLNSAYFPKYLKVIS